MKKSKQIEIFKIFGIFGKNQIFKTNFKLKIVSKSSLFELCHSKKPNSFLGTGSVQPRQRILRKNDQIWMIRFFFNIITIFC